MLICGYCGCYVLFCVSFRDFPFLGIQSIRSNTKAADSLGMNRFQTISFIKLFIMYSTSYRNFITSYKDTSLLSSVECYGVIDVYNLTTSTET